jgi:Rit1 N-terminal domain
MNGFVYVQGAADDDESWAHGLTSSLFWEHCDDLIHCTTNEQVVRMIHGIVGMRKDGIVDDKVSPIGLSSISLGLGVAKLGETCIVCGTTTAPESQSLYIPVPSKTTKAVVTMTKEAFPTSISFAIKHGILNGSPISIKATNPSRETVDLSIAVTLVLLSLFFDDNGIHS